jgi:hypothetical protein
MSAWPDGRRPIQGVKRAINPAPNARPTPKITRALTTTRATRSTVFFMCRGARPCRPRAGQLYRRAHRPRGRRTGQGWTCRTQQTSPPTSRGQTGDDDRSAVFYVEGQAKTLAWMTLEATAEPIAAESIATRDEVQRELDGIWSFTNDPASLIVGPRIFQLWVRHQG